MTNELAKKTDVRRALDDDVVCTRAMNRFRNSGDRPGPTGPSPSRARVTDAGIARGAGLAVAAVSAAIVVAIGMALFPVHKKAPTEPVAPTAVAPTPPPSSMAVADAAAVAPTP